MTINQGSVPPLGPHYPVAEGITLKAATFDKLYEIITEWRLRMGHPPGDPKKDVDNYVCTKWPHACRMTEQDGPPQIMRSQPLPVRIATWSAMMLRDQPAGGYEMVTQNQAEERAIACAACPFNKPWITCSSCVRSTLAALINLRRLRGTKLQDRTLGCECCGWDNSTAIHFPIDKVQLTEDIKSRLPQCCFIKRE